MCAIVFIIIRIWFFSDVLAGTWTFFVKVENLFFFYGEFFFHVKTYQVEKFKGFSLYIGRNLVRKMVQDTAEEQSFTVCLKGKLLLNFKGEK